MGGGGGEEKSQLPGFELTSQRVRRLRGYQLSYRGDRPMYTVNEYKIAHNSVYIRNWAMVATPAGGQLNRENVSFQCLVGAQEFDIAGEVRSPSPASVQVRSFLTF